MKEAGKLNIQLQLSMKLRCLANTTELTAFVSKESLNEWAAQAYLMEERARNAERELTKLRLEMADSKTAPDTN
ncbi:MAG: hypothetical protein K2X27_06685 [Candidatus Obscuribacterales bacterium]|nr:hypothetical protein [Candidatus Obscuribacterales bacterium]